MSPHSSSVPEPVEGARASLRRARHRGRRAPRRAAVGRRSFGSSLRALQELAQSGAQVSVHVADLDTGDVVLSGDDHVALPIAGLGVVPVLVETAAGLETGRIEPLQIIDRVRAQFVAGSGLWRSLRAPALPMVDLAVLAAAAGDPNAANALLDVVGHDQVRARMVSLGMPRSAVLDRFRDKRGPDDAPHVAVGTTREFAGLMAALVNSKVVNAAVSAQVSEWLSLNHDLSLVASATGLDPFAHDQDAHGLLFINKTGRDRGVRAEAGVLGGPRAGVAYALTVCFDDLSISHRLRAHEAFRILGTDLMEYAH
ncbi:serine hydrolase [Microbacterium esteraromaticum]|uniref:Serine hydrolase n=1 Tax=Microbacterium esteraromaticum TaxID=57043 RepID=A0A939ITL8_9MICO|nr:serine hydrolase [Microbacterium esteraromaticum]MBN8204501.1 serine hydrolase [Microbacterium esteraromaticum]MBN8414655.1 serine hydrolase [Microbacterium esteraromaticum]MBN8425083.1 serine hydrolase [Microbacterium esteraromaticum]MCA1306715.1 class A beta-lactamase-related serine hydrolase [Microbacterium esteraromaticum]WDH78662.1 serine hydrolase [Microbacterium esteraromaticum]